MSVTVRLDAGEGRLDTATVTCGYGKAYGTLPTPTREGYEFKGWYNENGKKIKEDTPCSASEDSVTLYAQWRGELRTVYFNYNGGTGEVTQKEYRIGEHYYGLPKGTRKGYDFLGWEVTSSDVFDVDSPTTLHAKWQLKRLTVTLNYNGGVPRVPSHLLDSYHNYLRLYDILYGQPISQSYDLSGSRDGYNFEGWYTSLTGGERVDPHQFYFEKNTTLYARWTPKRYRITFDAAPYGTFYGVGMPGEPIQDLPTAARDGYRFVGWRFDNSKNVIIEGVTLYNYTSPQTVTAVWEPIAAEP